VLDIDPPKGYYSLKELQAKYGLLLDTRRSSTASNGLHYFFQYPSDENTHRNAVGLAGLEGVDIRANGEKEGAMPAILAHRKTFGCLSMGNSRDVNL
jgi:Bifunctional DNA primase/polymerase, N-terminal